MLFYKKISGVFKVNLLGLGHKQVLSDFSGSYKLITDD